MDRKLSKMNIIIFLTSGVNTGKYMDVFPFIPSPPFLFPPTPIPIPFPFHPSPPLPYLCFPLSLPSL